MGWDEATARETEINGKSQSAKSDRARLADLIEYLKQMQADPDLITSPTISNLRTILAPARIAIIKGDRDGLISLLKKAGEMKNADLRLEVSEPQRDKLLYQRVWYPNDGEIAVLKVSISQLEYLKQKLRLQYEFVEETLD